MIDMKWMIASDIHGSAYWCEKLLSCYREEKADRLILLGDILYHGPRNDLPKDYNPKKVIAMLNEIKEDILCVRGNCDSEVDQMVLEFPIMSDYAVLDLTSKNLVYATHGHLKMSDLPHLKKGDIVLSGHTHIPKCSNRDGVIRINPGSVSIPKEGSKNSYIVFESGRFILKSIDQKQSEQIWPVNE